MPTVVQDIRYSLRLLVKDRSFSATALLTLAICIAANTAIFSVVRSVLLKPLPVEASEELVLLYNSYPNAGAPRVGAAVPDLFDRMAAVPALDEQALLRREGATFGREDGAERLTLLRATPSFFSLARMRPAAGRVFTETDGESGRNDVAILAHGFWQRQYGGDPAVVGRTIRLSGTLVEIVGVAPADFIFLWNDIDLYQPTGFTPEDRGDNLRHSNNWQMVGRLAPGATLDVAQQQVDALNAANDERFPNFRPLLADAGFHTVVVPLQDDLVRDIRPVLYLLWGGVLFVLLIGCVNLANLVMVRSSARGREMATRHAIGAELGRLARQVLTETLVLSLLGGTAGVLLGWWALGWIAAIDLSQLPRAYEIALDLPSAAVILGLTLLVGFLIGAAPVIGLWRMNLNLELREEGRGGTGGRRAQLARRALATAQVAIAFILLIGAGLLLASFRAVMTLDFGFEPARVQTATFNLPASAYPDMPALAAFHGRLLEEVRAVPGVASAGLTNSIPFGGNISNSLILAEGYVMEPGESLLAPSQILVSDGYFEAIGVELVSGRTFTTSDTADSTRVAIIDERLAEKFWPGEDAVGRRLYMPSDPQDITRITENTRYFNIVGVVAEVQMFDPRADFTPVGTYYFPAAQLPPRTAVLTVRAALDDAGLVATVRLRIASLDPELPLYRVQPLDRFIDDAMAGRRVPMFVAMAFGAVGLFLSAVGIYGVLAYGVAQRRRELGVRMALGGSAGRVFNLVLGDGVRITVIGLIVGAAGAVFVGRLMESMLFDVSPMDPTVLGLVAMTLGVVALIASVIPSWRATRINPIVVLGK
jgi:predicted permease